MTVGTLMSIFAVLKGAVLALIIDIACTRLRFIHVSPLTSTGWDEDWSF